MLFIKNKGSTNRWTCSILHSLYFVVIKKFASIEEIQAFQYYKCAGEAGDGVVIIIIIIIIIIIKIIIIHIINVANNYNFQYNTDGDVFNKKTSLYSESLTLYLYCNSIL